MPAGGAQEEKKMYKGHHWKNTRARDPLGGDGQCVLSKGHGSVAGQWPEHKLSTKPQPLCGEGSLTALRKRGWEETARA